jgi:hypothetical protein
MLRRRVLCDGYKARYPQCKESLSCIASAEAGLRAGFFRPSPVTSQGWLQKITLSKSLYFSRGWKKFTEISRDVADARENGLACCASKLLHR